MKRNFSFLKNKERRHGTGNVIAAAVMALAVTVSGIGSTALLATQPEGIVVAPTAVQTQTSGGRAKTARKSEQADKAQTEQPADSAAAEAEQPAESVTAQSAAPAAEEQQPETETQTATEAEQPAAAPEQQPAAPESTEPEAAESEQTENLEEENSFATFRQETPELAAEDPLATSAGQNNEIADRLSRAMESSAVTLTPEQIQQALDEGALDEWTGDIDSENCLKWLWNWLFGSVFDRDEDYSGWRTEGGKTYYYDSSTHQKFTGIHSIDGVLYYFNENGVMQKDVTFGIDVSKYQSNINWSQVKSSGVQFAIVRLGYRGYVTGTLVEDPMFESHFNGARSAGLRVGAYVFSQAINENEAREEAIASAYVLEGRSLDYPLYFDSEASGSSDGSGRADSLGKEDRTKCAVAFCEEVKTQGYKPGVYASTRWFEKRLDLSKLKSYSIWNAHYDVVSSSISCDIWQGTYRGKVNGYSGNIDINISYIG